MVASSVFRSDSAYEKNQKNICHLVVLIAIDCLYPK